MPTGTPAPSRLHILGCTLLVTLALALGRATAHLPMADPPPAAWPLTSPFAPAPRDAESNRVLSQTAGADMYRERVERAFDTVLGRGRYAVTVALEFEDTYGDKRTTVPADATAVRKEKHETYRSGASTDYLQDQVETRTALPVVDEFQHTACGRVKWIRCCLALPAELPDAAVSGLQALALGALGDKARVSTCVVPSRPPDTLLPAWTLVAALAFLLGARRLIKARLAD